MNRIWHKGRITVTEKRGDYQLLLMLNNLRRIAMRKTIFAALFVLLAMLAVTCDNAIMPGNLSAGPGQATPNTPDVTPVNTEFVTLNVSISDPSNRTRALLGDAAQQTAADFYEVVFVSPAGQTYRQTWYTGGGPGVTGDGLTAFSITVAVGDYSGGNNQGKAVMFAGERSGASSPYTGTLLGVGELDIANKVITKSTTSINFTLYPLKAAVTDDNDTSSFKITELFISGNDDFTDSADYVSNTGGTPAYPVYKVPTNAIITAKYNITCDAPVVAGSTPATGYVLISNPDSNVYFSALERDSFATTLTTTALGYDITGSIITTSSLSSAIAADGFTITVRTPTSLYGYSKLYIEVQAYAISANPGKANGTLAAIKWYIKGGLANTTVDPTTGATTGGAVLLKVEEEETDVSPVTPTW
jgi:hypothetical protein